jgi:PAS domain-containing protein
VFVLISDITRHHLAEAAVRESEDRLAKFMQASTEGIVFHKDGVISDANPPLLALTGYTLAEIAGRRTLEFIAPDQVAKVASVMASGQETAYDSVIDIHDFVTKNMGLPFTFDTSSGLAVWNYPVNRVRIDLTGDVERAEDGKTYRYTSYRLRYVTMGGPTGDARYVIKRDDAGNAVRALALDPMPDFAFRNEYWVCAPATNDTRGNIAFNAHALEAGYLTDKARKRLLPDLWRRQAAICYASLGAPGGGDTVFVFEQADGDLLVFPDAAAFHAAVAADRR